MPSYLVKLFSVVNIENALVILTFIEYWAVNLSSWLRNLPYLCVDTDTSYSTEFESLQQCGGYFHMPIIVIVPGGDGRRHRGSRDTVQRSRTCYSVIIATGCGIDTGSRPDNQSFIAIMDSAAVSSFCFYSGSFVSDNLSKSLLCTVCLLSVLGDWIKFVCNTYFLFILN